MKLKISQLKLKEGVNIVERISSRSISLPILKNIIIKAKKNIINISATDLEVGINWWGLAKIEEEGEVVIPATILSNFINFLPNKTINISSLKNNIIVECEDYKTQIKGFSPEDFPIIPNILEKNKARINIVDFCKGLTQIADIPSFSSTRPEISGVFFSFNNNQLKIAATDSYRLGEKILNLNEPIKESFSFILPQKAIKEIIAIFGEKEGEIKIVLGASQVLFESMMTELSQPDIHFISRQIEGDYPNYEEIIPKKNQIKAILNKNNLVNQIKAAGIFSGKVNEVIFKVDPDKKKIEIFSQNPEAGEYSSIISGKIEGKKEEVSFNYRYLIDGLNHIKEEEVLFEINGSSDPGVFRPVNRVDFLYIVMPIKAS